jgi:hypothetical protein
MTGAPAALVTAIVLQFVWIGIGLASTARDGQWMIATRQRKPRPIGI